MAWTTPGTAVAGDVLTAAFWNSNVRDNLIASPRGVIAKTSLTTAFNTSSPHTTFQDEGLSQSVTYEANRTLRIDLTTSLVCPGGANNILLRVLRGSTEVRRWSIRTERLDTAGLNTFSMSWIFDSPSSAATETFKVQIAGTNNTTVQSSGVSDYGRQLVISDMGSV